MVLQHFIYEVMVACCCSWCFGRGMFWRAKSLFVRLEIGPTHTGAVNRLALLMDSSWCRIVAPTCRTALRCCTNFSGHRGSTLPGVRSHTTRAQLTNKRTYIPQLTQSKALRDLLFYLFKESLLLYHKYNL